MQKYFLVKDNNNNTLLDKINIKQDLEFILANSDINTLSNDSKYITYQYHFMYVNEDYTETTFYFLILESKLTNDNYILPYVM